MGTPESKRVEECWRCGEKLPVYTVTLIRYRWENNLMGKLESEGGSQAFLCNECSCKLNRIFYSFVNSTTKRIDVDKV